jgi:serine/threonine protein phosphatase PrpC
LDEHYEVKGSRVGIFAIRGRRGKMEDMFDYVNQTDGLGVELYGVFDGHGSEVSPCFNRHAFLTFFLSS